jgi:phage gp45-like
VAFDPFIILQQPNAIKHQGLKLGEIFQEVGTEITLPNGEVPQRSELCQTLLICRNETLWEAATGEVDAQVSQRSQLPGLLACSASSRSLHTSEEAPTLWIIHQCMPAAWLHMPWHENAANLQWLLHRFPI